jgi:hypothetical protein
MINMQTILHPLPDEATYTRQLEAALAPFIDSEFRSLIPPLSDDERDLLTTSIKTEGCRDALVVWSGHNLLIDGHNRHDICQANNIPYQTVERSFDSREDVIVWVIRNQFARRNISSFVRSELALKLKGAIAGRAKANLVTSTGGGNPQPLLNSTKAESVDTRKELAKAAGVGSDTIRKVEVVTTKAPESIKQAARRGDISTHQATVRTNPILFPKSAGENVTARQFHAQKAQLHYRRPPLDAAYDSRTP